MTKPIRIALMSDLHIEFEPSYWNRVWTNARSGDSSQVADALRVNAELWAEPGHPRQGPDLRSLKTQQVDLLLLPGDIRIGSEAIVYADAAARYLGCPAYVCCGNHEAYRSDLLRLMPALRSAAANSGGRVTFLERDRTDIEFHGRRVAILGATLWTDYEVNGDAAFAMMAAEQALNDHRLIMYGGSVFTPELARQIHLETRAWLAREATRARDEGNFVIIMTHHAPIPDANPPRYEGGELAPAFVSDLRSEILDWKPDLWVWGHTHFSMEDQLGGTKLSSAQRGYIGIEPDVQLFRPAVVTV